MAAGTYALVAQLDNEDVMSVCQDGTYVYFSGNNGQIWQYNPGGPSKALFCWLVSEDVIGLASDGTNLYAGCASGNVYKIPIATKVAALFSRTNAEILDCVVLGNYLYVSTLGTSQVVSYTLS